MFIGYNLPPLVEQSGILLAFCCDGIPSDIYIFQLRSINSLINIILSSTAPLLHWKEMKGDICPLSPRHTKRDIGIVALTSIEIWKLRDKREVSANIGERLLIYFKPGRG